MTFRTTPELRERLVAAAGDRPLGDEIRQRLEASFAPERAPIGDAQTLALLDGIVAAATMLNAGVGRAADILAGVAGSSGPWHGNPAAFAAMRQIIVRLLGIYQPPGPEPDEAAVQRIADLAFGAALHAVTAREIAEANKPKPAQPERHFITRALRRRKPTSPDTKEEEP